MQGGAGKKFARSQCCCSLVSVCGGREPWAGSASRLLHLQELGALDTQPRAAVRPRQEELEPRWVEPIELS